ncbi:sensor histidine kinase [Cyclobacterium jeungdonense]|uniref:histidine kinase n=1 Tax=Cyclobacterium jeungdonense TaxID=708087 RepID=A0ABT8CEE5_9BACT|nr:PAS domain-containing sensor histidine kinase [Cyclobacterium jeungdonense]MDN3690153.1 PAS domain-containing sensor histidine kinase [Cyclobacterium jeungdonense]
MDEIKKKIRFINFIVSILVIFVILIYFWRDQFTRSLPYFLIVFSLLLISDKRIFHYILGILTFLTIIFDYFISTNSVNSDIFDVSEGLVILFTIWIGIYLNYQHKHALNKKIGEIKWHSAIFETINEGILIINQAGEIIMANRYAEELFGYSKNELKGKKVESLIPDRISGQHAGPKDRYYQLLNSPLRKENREFHAIHKNSYEFPIEISLGYSTVEADEMVIVFVKNISEGKKAEAQLLKVKAHSNKLNQDLEFRLNERKGNLEEELKTLKENNKSLTKMEEELIRALERERELGELKSRFVTMASHEFRTPLSTILSSVFLLENFSQEQLEQSKTSHLQRIRRSVNNMTTILNEFLSLSKLEEGRISPSYSNTNIRLCVQEIMEELELIKKTDQQIRYTHEGSLETFYLDPQFLRNILINLLSNAIKFSDPSEAIELISKADAGQLIIKVIDHGMGIPEQEKKYLFNRFFRAKNANNIEGTGLGLNIVKKYVDLMKGTVVVESQLNQGSTFIVTIPSNPDFSDFQKQE